MAIEVKYRFVFDFFMKGTVPPMYKAPIKNKLTNKSLPISINQADFKNIKLITVWDIPEYIDVPEAPLNKNISRRKIRQYKGFLIDLTGSKSVDDYLLKQLSARNRKKLRSKKKRLEADHNIEYCFFYGKMERAAYDKLFSQFAALLEKRFDEKRVHNNNLHIWHYYQELAYPLLLKKRASLFVIYDKEQPINIALHFHLEDTVFSYIQTYDIAYSDYNMGDISMLKRLELFFRLGIKTIDLSMGTTDYKIKWCNYPYHLYFHLFYRKNNLISWSKMITTAYKLRLKQYLRDKDILGKRFRLDKLKYRLKGASSA
ncbi:GNAT family N-acetyltransferase [Cytophaga sp. FL35]|uniref:GNAT family N-acetyltransferase n=1 Tax=Cytophaga sp. FL35 TaxID=1904456 RepID=UPI001653A977|nr:GNAT family N-acetyltransferase [Cytophaga sp. FL35]MBC6997204.1 GNAT family N-acetyltransferase [Cytophaga sp. FL35]